MDVENPGTAIDRTGHPNPVPRVVGPIRRTRPVLVRDVEFLRANTDRAIKATIPGPFTMSQQAQDDHYGDEEALAMALAEAVNAELRDLFAAGADVVQLDEPYLQARPEKARRFAIGVINRALEGAAGTTALHTCFGYAHVVHSRPQGYPYFAELAAAAVDQISLESAQQNVDLSILGTVPEKRFQVGVIDLADQSPVEDVENRREPDPQRAAARAARAPSAGARLRHEVPAQAEGLRQAQGPRPGRGRGARRALTRPLPRPTAGYSPTSRADFAGERRFLG